MHVWKLRKYLRGSKIIHGSHMHQSVRNAKSYARVRIRAEDAGKDGRGMMETD